MNQRIWFVIIFSIVSILSLAPRNSSAMECKPEEFSFSKLDIEGNDVEFLKAVMDRSYGYESKEFIPELNAATSNFYYKDSKAESLMVFFTAKFKSEIMAKKAAEYLKTRWIDRKTVFYDVVKTGKDVTWFANNRLDADCFLKMTKIEKEKLIKK